MPSLFQPATPDRRCPLHSRPERLSHDTSCPQATALARLPASQNTKAAKLLIAATHLLASLERGIPLDAHLLREAMTTAFDASDQHGAWVWKDAYEASEAAAVLFLHKYGPGILKKAGSPARALAMIERLSALLPSHTRRSEESNQFQQFSTPLGLGFLVGLAAQLTLTNSFSNPPPEPVFSPSMPKSQAPISP